MEKNELYKKTLENNVLKAKPLDYADRNRVYLNISLFMGWVLQVVSIIAASYLAFDFILNMFPTENNYVVAIIFLVPVAFFAGVEYLRRWLIDTSGYHYLATFNVENKVIKSGKVLKVKLIALIGISVVMIVSGVSGAYQFTFDVAPKAVTKDVKEVTKSVSEAEKNQLGIVKETEKTIADAYKERKKIQDNPANYNVWKGTAYITPDAKAQIDKINTQIDALLKTKQKALDMISETQKRHETLTEKTEKENEQTISVNFQDKTNIAIVASVIWFIFEVLLLSMLLYVWVYKYNFKLELLLNGASKSNDTEKPAVIQVTKSVKRKATPKSIRQRIKSFTENTQITPVAKTPSVAPVFNNTEVTGFEYGKNVTPKVENETKVVVDKATRVLKNGFNYTCLTCEKQGVAKNPNAKFCPDTKDEEGNKKTSPCRNKWHNSNHFTREEKLARWVKYGHDAKDFRG